MEAIKNSAGSTAEQDTEFHRIADARLTELLASGMAVPWDDAKAYLEARARGERPSRPSPKAISLNPP